MDSENLYDAFEAYVSHAASEIQQKDIPAVPVRKFEVKTKEQPEISVDQLPRFDRSEIYYHAFIDSDPAQELVAYVDEEYNWELDYIYLRRVLMDIFGKHGESLDSWEDQIEPAFEKFKEDAEDRITKFRVQTYLQGIDVYPTDIHIADDAVIRQPAPSDLSYVEDIRSFSHLNPTSLMECDALLEFDVDATSEYGSYPPMSVLREFYLKVLRLYGRSNVPMIAETSELRTFLGDNLGWSVPQSSRDPLPQSTLTEDDESSLQRLVELLSINYSKQDAAFDYPLSAAIDHFETSIEKRVYSRESITFAVIGLEALYTSGRGKVSTYCAFLLGSASPHFDPDSVQSTLEDAYDDYRNSWAHGGSRQSGGKKVQRRLWDYLRGSIVLFSWLNRNECLNKKNRNKTLGQINQAMIDEDVRSEFLDELSQLKLDSYLQIPKRT